MTTGIPSLRKWQKRALEKVLQLWKTRVGAKALIAACPGAGKTLLTGMLLRELLREGDITLAIILAPTSNVQLRWVEVLETISLKATSEASNAALRWRKEKGVAMTEDYAVLVLTYAQLARDSSLIAELARRGGKTIIVGDEIHHADDDEKFGEAVQTLADGCIRSLALSGTPFNSSGGALALCDHEEDIDDSGKPIRRTIATDTYSYGEAILDRTCRSVEFLKIYGRGDITLRLIETGDLIKREVDLGKQRKSDSLSALLDPEGEYMEECARQTVRSLAEFREAGDKRTAALVVTKDKSHGSRMAQLLMRICKEEGRSYLIQEIYNDTPKAHQRVANLVEDTTDIVVSVRMISEGVDVPRLRVGLFATDWLTQMFFIQFIGRFVRYEDRLDESQFARVIIPAHARLLDYAREIEKMVESAAIVEPGEGPPPPEKKTEFVDSSTEATAAGVIHRSVETEKLDLAEALYAASPWARGQISHTIAIRIAEDLHLQGAQTSKPDNQEKDWGALNDSLARAVVRRLKRNGEPIDVLFRSVNTRANSAVGILKKDKMTASDTLKRRHAYLQQWLKRLINGEDNDAAE